MITITKCGNRQAGRAGRKGRPSVRFSCGRFPVSRDQTIPPPTSPHRIPAIRLPTPGHPRPQPPTKNQEPRTNNFPPMRPPSDLGFTISDRSAPLGSTDQGFYFVTLTKILPACGPDSGGSRSRLGRCETGETELAGWRNGM